MKRRSPGATLAASPTMVGAVTTLILIVAVFLAYNANNGLAVRPRLFGVGGRAERSPPRRKQRGQDRRNPRRRGRIDRSRSRPERERDDRFNRGRRERGRRARARRQAQPEARQGRRAPPGGLGVPGSLPVHLRPQVPRDRAGNGSGRRGGPHLRRHERRRPRRVRHPDRSGDLLGVDPRAGQGRLLPGADRVRRDQQHVRQRDANRGAREPRGLRRRVRRTRRVAERRDRGPASARREPRARLTRPLRSLDSARALHLIARAHGGDRRSRRR